MTDINDRGFQLTLDGNKRVDREIVCATHPLADFSLTLAYTHEIYALNGNPNAQRVIDAITHSRKRFRQDERETIQSDISISIASKSSKYRRHHISDGVKEFKRMKRDGDTKANPLKYLHVDEKKRATYYWDIK